MDVIIVYKDGTRQAIPIDEDEVENDQEAIEHARKQAGLTPDKLHTVKTYLIERKFL